MIFKILKATDKYILKEYYVLNNKNSFVCVHAHTRVSATYSKK